MIGKPFGCQYRWCPQTFDSLEDARQHADEAHADVPEPVPDGGQVKRRNSEDNSRLRMISVCHECGVINSELRPADNPHPRPGTGVGHQHLKETGHHVRTFPYSDAPEDIQEMIDQIEPEAIDWLRIVDWMTEDVDDEHVKYKVAWTSGGVQFESELMDYERAQHWQERVENAVVKHDLGEEPLVDDQRADVKGVRHLIVDVDGGEGPE